MAYPHRKTLFNHRKKHTGERPSSCELSFAQKQYPTNHRRTHTGERPYRCDDCGMGAHRPSSLAQHKHTHKGKVPYRCEQRGLGFMQRSTPLSKATHSDNGRIAVEEWKTL